MARKLSYKGQSVILVPKVGVAVIQKTGIFLLNYAKGYRFQFATDNLR
ncbi:MAG: hypothetical protein L3J89_13775 [Gammaproteobacteria bacterium]|nr:hypothetical protein [Gammaproteobacteria bacterium]